MYSCAPAGDAPQPPAVRYGEDACDECRMIINEARFAAATNGEGLPIRLFDDIGCLILFLKKHPEQKRAQVWVHDYLSAQWLSADSSQFVMGTPVETPMGHGILAFRDNRQADSLATASGGQTVLFKELAGGF